MKIRQSTSALFILIIFSCHLFAQDKSPEAPAISALKKSQSVDFTLLPTLSAFERVCGYSLDDATGIQTQLKPICEIVTHSELCQEVEKDDLLQCDAIDLNSQLDLWDFISGCAKGVFDSITEIFTFIWDIMTWVWDQATSSEAREKTYDQASEYINIAQHYLLTEFQKAYDQTSWPLREIKAAKIMAGSLANMLLSQISSMIEIQYQQLGCLNFKAKSAVLCKFIGEIFIPPAAVIGLLKHGSKAIKQFKNLENAFGKLKTILKKIPGSKILSRVEISDLRKKLHQHKGPSSFSNVLDFNDLEKTVKSADRAQLQKFRKSYQEIYDFLASPTRTNTQIKSFANEVIDLSERDGISPREAFLKLFDQMEKKHGFNPVQNLDNLELRADKFNEFFKKKSLFNDSAFSHDPHGEFSHRLQWYLVMKEMELHPEKFIDSKGKVLKASDIYQSMEVYKHNITGQNPVWIFLFDQEYKGSFSSPENFFNHYHEILSPLGILNTTGYF